MLYSIADIYIGRSLDLLGEFCEDEARLHRDVIGEGDVVVDAGANIGSHTVVYGKAVGPAGRVHAFEPQRLVFQVLCAIVALHYGLHIALDLI